MYFGIDRHTTGFLAEHVLEHLTPVQVALAACNTYKALDDNEGYWRVAVPDWWAQRTDVSTSERMRADIDDGHVLQLNGPALTNVLSSAGFTCTILEHTDAQSKFRYTPWNATEGNITRSAAFDTRKGISVIVDAVKRVESTPGAETASHEQKSVDTTAVSPANKLMNAPNVVADVNARSKYPLRMTQLSESDEQGLRDAVVNGSMTFTKALMKLFDQLATPHKVTWSEGETHRSTIQKLIAKEPWNVCYQLALVGIMTK
jgi:predicted SAM-dependent methyltransferase